MSRALRGQIEAVRASGSEEEEGGGYESPAYKKLRKQQEQRRKRVPHEPSSILSCDGLADRWGNQGVVLDKRRDAAR